MLVSEGDSVIQNEQLAVIYSQDLEDSLNEAETSLIKKTGAGIIKLYSRNKNNNLYVI